MNSQKGSGVNLQGAFLEWAKLRRANLRGANLQTVLRELATSAEMATEASPLMAAYLLTNGAF